MEHQYLANHLAWFRVGESLEGLAPEEAQHETREGVDGKSKGFQSGACGAGQELTGKAAKY